MRWLWVVVVTLTVSGLSAQLRQRITFNPGKKGARTQEQYLTYGSKGLRYDASERLLLLDHPRTGDPAQKNVPLSERLDDLRQHFVNLPAIADAEWTLDTTGSDTIVDWTLHEARTIFPIVNFGGVRGNRYYQLGVQDFHFRGRGQQLTAFYQNIDGEHNYYLSLINPTYRGSRWGYLLETRRYAAIEPVFFPSAAVDYRYANTSLTAGISHNYHPRNQASFALSAFRERYLKLRPEEAQPGPDDLTEDKVLLKLGHVRNRIDYHYERLAGSHHQTYFQAVHNFRDRSNFLIFWHDLRYYRLVGYRGNLALRLRAGISSNGASPFAPFVLDSQVNIRGSGNRIDRGTAQLILNLEYRHVLWHDRRDRFSFQGVAFSDLGSWRNPGGELSDLHAEENIRHFVGGGLRFNWLKAFNATVRVDYGVDVRNEEERGWVVGFGQYF